MEKTEVVKVTPELVLKNLFLEQYAKGYQALNPVYTGFNQVCKVHFGIDPIAFTKGLNEKGLLNISGRKDAKGTKSVIIYLTDKGMTAFGIRPPTSQKVGPSSEKKIDKLLSDTAKRFQAK